MSDLKERIGRKVGYNDSWIRPGYQIKPSPTKQSQTRKRIPTATGYESGQSSHEEDSRRHPSHLGFRISSRPGGAASLLERMGLSPSVESGDEDVADTEDVAKSLIERVGPVVTADSGGYDTSSRAQTPDNVDPCTVNAVIETLITETSNAQPLARNSSNTGAAIANVTKVPTNSDRDRNGEALSPQVHHTFQDHALDGEHLKDKSISSKQGHTVNSTPPRGSPNPPHPSHLDQLEDANLTDSYSNDVDMLNARSSRNPTPLHSSSIEDGEVRELLVPLVLQNASGRMSAAQHAGPQPISLDMDTLTDKVCFSFQEIVKDLRKGMDSSSVENSTNHGSIDPGSAGDAYQQARNIQEEAAPQPIGSAVQFATHREEPSRPNAPLTYERDWTTLRYTPSPERHHRSHSSVENDQSLRTDSLRNDRRSPSSSHHTGHRRALLDERTYRHPPNAHEYHSFEPHTPHNGQQFISPSRHSRHRSPSDRPKYRPPPNAHEYYSPEPPSPHPRPPPRLQSSVSASQSHVFPDRKYRRSPDSRSRSPYESARRARGGYRGRRRWDDYPTRRSASPRLRRPYEPYSSNRRGSRSPRCHSQSSDSQMSDRLPASRYSPDRRPRTKKILDNDLRSQSTPISEPSRNTQESLSEEVKTTCTEKPPSNTEQNAIGETTTIEHKHVLPCHHVPGLWFVKVALNDVGTLECSFEIDSETAIKWKFSGINDKPKADITDDSLQTSLSLQIRCLATDLVEETFCSLQNNATPEDIALAMFSLETEWPTQGHLVIAVNPQHEKDNTKQIFLPEKLGPASHICIDDLVHEGQNIVQFIQLSDMAGKVFVLCATQKQDVKPDDMIHTSKGNSIIGIDQGVVRISPLE